MALSPLYWVDRCVDFLFAVDMLVNCNLIFFDEATQRLVSARRTVVRRYLSTWIFVDLLSIFPFEDAVVFSNTGVSNANDLQALRVLRLLRLFKLLRIVRATRVFQRFENQLNVRYGVLSLWRNGVIVALVCHWLACGYHLVTIIAGEECTWINFYFTRVACVRTANLPPPVELYIAALYAAAYTVATVGYGDVPPQNKFERLYLIFAMALGAGLFAYVVGNICDVLVSLSRRNNEFQNLSALRCASQTHRLPSPDPG